MDQMMSGMSMGPSGPLMMLALAALVVVPFWFIFGKAGYTPWLSLLMIVPVVNVVMLYVLAFAEWPRLKQFRTGSTRS